MSIYKLLNKLIVTLILCNSITYPLFGLIQSDKKNNELIFISDTQAPIWVETVRLPSNRNSEATDSLFSDIVKQKPLSLFILGDLVSTGSDIWLWQTMDKNISSVRKNKTPVYAIMGNHEYMFTPSAGKKYFKSRFPNQSLTGYYKIVDSIAVVMLNSNFYNLSGEEINNQNKWFKSIMDSLERNEGVKTIIAGCHHSPFTNSMEVSSSKEVQKFFLPKFIKSKKAKVFISGHSHNLEHFKQKDKDFFVIGGGGGLKQPLFPVNNQPWHDIISDYDKLLYFYIRILRFGDDLFVFARGFKNNDFNNFFELELARISLVN